MNFKPILFSTLMVQAILEGRKTMTRRVVKGAPLAWIEVDGFTPEYVALKENDMCKFGNVGDVLWVRETWRNLNGEFIHKAGYWNTDTKNWKPSIHMPKTACRLFLEITDIKIERLQDITEGDAIAEGVQENLCDDPAKCPSNFKGESCCGKGEYFRYPVDFEGEPCGSAVESFESLWQSINGTWDHNPWVWVISFKRIDKPENFQ